MRPRRPRHLTREESLLWGEIAKLVTPLRASAKSWQGESWQGESRQGATAPAGPPSPAPPGQAAPPEPARRPKASRPVQAGKPIKLGDLAMKPQPVQTPGMQAQVRHASGPTLPYKPSPPIGPGLERRERRGLQRGLLAIEARIDLHGLFQAEAHAALVAFLMRARGAGLSRVLVVTGKGGADEHALFSDRGVLRRSVPHWLRGAELRSVVLGFEEAARHHGGAGALYVRLKRR